MVGNRYQKLQISDVVLQEKPEVMLQEIPEIVLQEIPEIVLKPQDICTGICVAGNTGSCVAGSTGTTWTDPPFRWTAARQEMMSRSSL